MQTFTFARIISKVADFIYCRNPWVCGVTSLGYDHVAVLGGTVESIAWNKAGIFKVINVNYNHINYIFLAYKVIRL